MNTLLQILLEARNELKGKFLDKIASFNLPISIRYQGRWIKDVTIKSIEKRGKDRIIKADVKSSSGATTSQEFKEKDITDWGESEFRQTQLKAARKTDKEKKAEPKGAKEPKGADVKAPAKEKERVFAKAPRSGKDIVDAIENKRVVKIYYQGLLEYPPKKGDKKKLWKGKPNYKELTADDFKPGWRTILPVAYGARTTKSGGRKEYIRAWQWDGKTVRGIPKWKLFRRDRITN